MIQKHMNLSVNHVVRSRGVSFSMNNNDDDDDDDDDDESICVCVSCHQEGDSHNHKRVVSNYLIDFCFL